jgi:molecular chaperone DnaK (HSP70)
VSSDYIVGIDLGTTNSVVAEVTGAESDESPAIELAPIAQLVDPNEVEALSQLPSFLFVPGPSDFPAGSLDLPWKSKSPYVVGALARKRGAENPARLVASAKSWLSHAGAARTSPILPWGTPDEVAKLSPVDASAEYLAHVRASWEHAARERGEKLSLADQTVLVTVPASFDEEARELTRRAAERAGLADVTLLEEPQAAFYAWIEARGDAWREDVAVGDLVVVVDVGGGTTDFSLIAVTEEDGELSLERVAVGDHILLGGDNMDLALARTLQARLEERGERVDSLQLQSLWHQCRLAKERLLSDPKAKKEQLVLLGRGSKLVGGSVKIDLEREDVDRILLEGFFPEVASDEMPARQRRIGLQEIGLPYAADAAVTKHLARFLRRAGESGGEVPIRRGESGLACPTHVLFNGGVTKADALRERVVAVLDAWLAAEGLEPVTVLASDDPDHAVARGAAYYGRARTGRGIRIRGGAARTYYIGIESAMPAVPGLAAPLKALCVVPFGMEEGTEAVVPDREFGLLVGEPAEFRFLTSTVRKSDEIGEIVEDWGDEIEELNPLEVTLGGDEDAVVPVRLETRVTELGTLELWCVARDGAGRWTLELNSRERDEEV